MIVSFFFLIIISKNLLKINKILDILTLFRIIIQQQNCNFLSKKPKNFIFFKI